MNGRRLALFVLEAALLALAAWAAWPAPERPWQPFSATGVVEVQFPGGTGVAADVWSSQGRLGARRVALLVFRELQEPESLEVEEPKGQMELLLGAPDGSDGSLKLDEHGAVFGVAGSGQPDRRLEVDHVRHAELVWEQGAYRALVDGQQVGEPISGSAPGGPAHLRLSTGASLASVLCSTRGGDARRAQGAPAAPGTQRLIWALLAGLLGLFCLNDWVPMVNGGRAVSAAGRIAGCLAALALACGVAWSLREHNLERLTTTPETCEQQPLSLPGEQAVFPGHPLPLGERRDGDFTLNARVVLQERSAVDLLLRAELPRIDRQILVTLSSDPALPSGVSRNLGTFLKTTPAARGLEQLPAGQPLALEVRCRDERTEVFVDGKAFGSVADLDLRAGRTAFHALSGSATVSALELQPTGQPRALDSTLLAWEGGAAVAAAAALILLVLRSGRGLGGLLWCWPLAAAVAPFAPDPLLLPLLALSGVLLLFTPRAGHRLMVWVTGAVLIGLTWWAHEERVPALSPLILNQLAPTDFTGPPIDARYIWARHPLCRRFNGYIKDQTLRDEAVTAEKAPGTLRIVTLGSSSTFGYGVSARDTWSAQLEMLLSYLWPKRTVQVVNAGVPGATAERLLYFLQGVLLDLHPDAVVIDLSFNDHIMGGTHDERAHFAALTSTGIGPLEGLLADWRASRQRRGWQALVSAEKAGRPLDAADVKRYSTEPAARFGDSIRDMVRACQAAGVAVLLVQEPTRPGETTPWLEAYHAELAAIGLELGVPVVGPQPELDAAKGPLYLDVVHPNGEGHRIIARVVGGGIAGLLGPGR